MSTADTTMPAKPYRYPWLRAIRSLGFSLFINAICPYVIYRVLEPNYPQGSITPLLASTIFPVFGLLYGIVRTRSADIIAIISLVEILISIVVTIVAADVRLALIARALQGTLTGLFFLLTTLLRRPLIYYFARQFMAVTAPEVTAGFDALQRAENYVTFRRLTVIWGVGLIVMSGVNLALALTVSPANYLLLSPIAGIGTNVVLIGWTIRTARRRFEPGAR